MSDRWTKRENINDKINPEYYIGTTIQLADFIKAFNLDFFEGSIIHAKTICQTNIFSCLVAYMINYAWAINFFWYC